MPEATPTPPRQLLPSLPASTQHLVPPGLTPSCSLLPPSSHKASLGTFPTEPPRAQSRQRLKVLPGLRVRGGTELPEPQRERRGPYVRPAKSKAPKTPKMVGGVSYREKVCRKEDDYSALERNELSSHEKTGRHLKCVSISERSQFGKTAYCVILAM